MSDYPIWLCLALQAKFRCVLYTMTMGPVWSVSQQWCVKGCLCLYRVCFKGQGMWSKHHSRRCIPVAIASMDLRKSKWPAWCKSVNDTVYVPKSVCLHEWQYKAMDKWVSIRHQWLRQSGTSAFPHKTSVNVPWRHLEWVCQWQWLTVVTRRLYSPQDFSSTVNPTVYSLSNSQSYLHT